MAIIYALSALLIGCAALNLWLAWHAWHVKNQLTSLSVQLDSVLREASWRLTHPVVLDQAEYDRQLTARQTAAHAARPVH